MGMKNEDKMKAIDKIPSLGEETISNNSVKTILQSYWRTKKYVYNYSDFIVMAFQCSVCLLLGAC